MPRFDTDRLRSEHELSTYLPLRGIPLRQNGREWETCCPFHAENTPSFQVYRGKRGTQEFKCQGCGEHGDIITFVQKWDGLSFDEACEVLGGRRVVTNERQSRSTTHPVQDDPYAYITAIAPPAGAKPFEVGKHTGPIWNPKNKDKPVTGYRPSSVHPYHNSKGKLVGYVLRIDLPDGHKITPTILWCKNEQTGEQGWSHCPMKQSGRPMYRLPSLLTRKHAQVLILGGERKTDEAQALLPSIACVSYLGGDNNARKTDWTPLAGRDVILWPDNDDSGQDAAETIAAAATEAGANSVKIVRRPGDEKPKGWDIADAIKEKWTKAEVVDWARSRATPWTPPAKQNDGDKGAEVPSSASTTEGRRADGTAPEALKPTQQIKPDPEPESKPEPERRKPQAKRDPNSNVIRLQGALDPPDLEADKPWQSYLEMNEHGAAKPKLMTNFVTYMQRHPSMRGVLAKNAFSQSVMLLRAPPWHKGDDFKPRAFADADAVQGQMWLERANLTPSSEQAGRAMMAAAEVASFDPVKDYLNSLHWDGVERLRTWLITHMGATHSKGGVERMFGRCWLIAAVARNLTTKPDGEKVDNMIVFEGAQGKRKSMALEKLATMNGVRYFTDNVDDITSKDAIMQMRNAVIVEMAEFASLDSVSVNTVKKWASVKVDSFRPPYGRAVIDLPRRSVLAGTINPSGIGYLKDATGGRRFWPVYISGEVDIPAIERDRDQLWAEAVHLYRAGERWWLEGTESEAAATEQKRRFQADAWAEGIENYLATNMSDITVDKIFRFLEIPRYQQHERNYRRITDHLKHLDYKSRKKRVNGLVKNVYYREGDDNDNAEILD